MNRPSNQTMVLGHPVVSGVVAIAAAITGYAAFRSNADGGYLVSGGCCALIAMTAKANEAATGYKRWKREWESLDGPGGQPRRSDFKSKLEWIGAGFIALAILAAFCGQPAYLLGLLLLCLPILATKLLRGVWRRLFRRRYGHTTRPVCVVAKPILTSPSLAQAYARLPEHCLRILANGRS